MSQIIIDEKEIIEAWESSQAARQVLNKLFPAVLKEHNEKLETEERCRRIRLLPGTLIARMSGEKFKLYMVVNDKDLGHSSYRVVNLTNGYVWKTVFTGSTDTISLYELDQGMRKTGLRVKHFIVFTKGVWKQMVLQLLGSKTTYSEIVFNQELFTSYAQNLSKNLMR